MDRGRREQMKTVEELRFLWREAQKSMVSELQLAPMKLLRAFSSALIYTHHYITYLALPPSVFSATPGSLCCASVYQNHLVHYAAQSLFEDFVSSSIFPSSQLCSFLSAFPPLCRGYGSHSHHLAGMQNCLKELARPCRAQKVHHSLVPANRSCRCDGQSQMCFGGV